MLSAMLPVIGVILILILIHWAYFWIDENTHNIAEWYRSLSTTHKLLWLIPMILGTIFYLIMALLITWFFIWLGIQAANEVRDWWWQGYHNTK